MATPHLNLIQAGFKAPDPDHTPFEALLTFQYGDLHQYIPNQLNNGMTQEQLAKRMNCSPAWLSGWLKSNGYRRATRWERK